MSIISHIGANTQTSASNPIINSNNFDELSYSKCGEELASEDQIKFNLIQTQLFNKSSTDVPLPEILRELSSLSMKYSLNCKEDSNTKWAIEFFTSVIKNRITSESETETMSETMENKRDRLQAAIVEAYANFPVDQNSQVVLLSCVLSDGLGDYFALINFLKSLKQTSYRPPLEVLIAVPDQPGFTDIITRFPLPEMENIKVNLIVKEREENREEHAWRWNQKYFSQLAHPVVIGLPYAVACDELAYANELGSFQYVREMGTWNTVPISLVCNDFQFGINTGEFNYFDSSVVVSGLRPLEERIKQLLMGVPKRILDELMRKEIHTLESVMDFLQTNQLFSGYFKFALGLEAFINVIAKACQYEEKDISIVTKSYIPTFHKAYLKDMGIGRIEVHSQLKPMKEIIICSQNTKILRLYQYLPLPFEQYLAIRSVCESLEGCTGNNSFYETLALNHLPFYEVSVAFTRYYFSETLPQLIQNSTLSSYYRQMTDIRSEGGDCIRKKDLLSCEKLGFMLKNWKLYEAQKLFFEHLQNQYTHSRYAEGLIKRGLLLKRYKSQIRSLEEQTIKGSIANLVVEDRIELFKKAVQELLNQEPRC